MLKLGKPFESGYLVSGINKASDETLMKGSSTGLREEV